jgi:hypothetical protein
VTSLRLKVVAAQVTVEADLEPTISKLVEARAGALLIGDNIYFVQSARPNCFDSNAQ